MWLNGGQGYEEYDEIPYDFLIISVMWVWTETEKEWLQLVRGLKAHG